MIPTIAAQRLDAQGISRPRFTTATEVVAWHGAIQAQEFAPARWALGLRLHGRVGDDGIADAIDRGNVLRTHVMRPTWHFVAARDIRWLQQLTAPRVQRIAAGYNRRLGLEAATLRRGTRIIERALRDCHDRTRTELAVELRSRGVEISGQRLAHLMMHAELELVVCSGPYRGRHSTYALLEERAARVPALGRDEALAELTKRFFTSHGPATVRDFVWWSGLTTADARRGLEMVRARRAEIEGLTYWTTSSEATRRRRPRGVYLLPIYDEYLVAYRDRVAVPHGAATLVLGTVQHALIVDGQVAGTWRLSPGSDPTLSVHPARRLSATERRGVERAIRRYSRHAIHRSIGRSADRIERSDRPIPISR